MPELSGSFDRELFLREYWQKKPLLIKGLLANFSDPLSPEELAGLACEPSVESRLIEGTVTPDPSGQGIVANLNLTHGPIDENRFPDLPDKNWTVLVQAVDQWVPEVAELRNCFDFVPSWRLEDVMISFATPGGTVGPHFDHYDVFLIQGSGSRRWLVGPRCTAQTQCVSEAGLSLLPQFKIEDSFDLEPGDALYLPPRYAHWGTALGAGLCYSIGLRSPSLAEMLEGFSDALISRADPALRYEDPDPAIPAHPAEIKPAMLDDAYTTLMSTLAQRDAFNRWFGCQVTQPKYPEQIEPPEREYSLATLEEELRSGLILMRHPASRFASMRQDEETLLCFVDGACFELSAAESDIVTDLTRPGFSGYAALFQSWQTALGRELILNLVNQGSLVLDEP